MSVVAALAVGATMLALGACSSDSSSAPSTSLPASADATATTVPRTDLDATTTTTIGPVQVSLRTTPLGDVVVDADGMTLYAKVTLPVDGCSGTCLDAWPQVLATSVTAGAGIAPTLVTIVNPDGTTTTTATTATDGAPTDSTTTTSAPTTSTSALAQGAVAIAGHLLYRFVGDAVPGDTTGQGFNSTFFVVLADGTLVQPTTTTTSTTAP